jgi:hypothetical protein
MSLPAGRMRGVEGQGGSGLRIEVSEEIRADHGHLRRLIGEGFTGIDPSGVEVRVERARRAWESFTGRAYFELPRRPRPRAGTRYLVRLKVPSVLRNRGYPMSYKYPRRKTAPSITVRDWRERFIALVAHEAFHIRQFREGLRRSEVVAERWAASVLEDWREGRIGAPTAVVGVGVVGSGRGQEERVAAAASRWEQLSLLPR